MNLDCFTPSRPPLSVQAAAPPVKYSVSTLIPTEHYRPGFSPSKPLSGRIWVLSQGWQFLDSRMTSSCLSSQFVEVTHSLLKVCPRERLGEVHRVQPTN